MNLCIDLCCGLGGLSSAFKANGWEVITVDIEAKFSPTICKDIRQVTRQDIQAVAKSPLADYDVIVMLASPPCERFSKATDWPKKGVRLALEIVGACLELIVEIQPKYWALENPRWGYLRWFIGEPSKRLRLNAFGYQTVKPTGLWGNISLGLIPDSAKVNVGHNAWENFMSRNPAKRAEMPYGLSDKIRLATEAQEN